MTPLNPYKMTTTNSVRYPWRTQTTTYSDKETEKREDGGEVTSPEITLKYFTKRGPRTYESDWVCHTYGISWRWKPMGVYKTHGNNGRHSHHLHITSWNTGPSSQNAIFNIDIQRANNREFIQSGHNRERKLERLRRGTCFTCLFVKIVQYTLSYGRKISEFQLSLEQITA